MASDQRIEPMPLPSTAWRHTSGNRGSHSPFTRPELIAFSPAPSPEDRRSEIAPRANNKAATAAQPATSKVFALKRHSTYNALTTASATNAPREKRSEERRVGKERR